MKTSRLNRFIKRLLVPALISTLLSPAVGAIQGASAQTNASQNPQELQAFDTNYARVFQNPNGTLTSKIYFAPVNYKDSDGNFQHIDTNFVSNGSHGYQVTKNLFKTYFSDTANSSDLETVKYKGTSVSFSFAGKDILSALGPGVFHQPNPGTPHSNHNELTYSDIMPSISLQEDVTSEGVKEQIILDKYQPGLHSFAFVLNTNGLTPQIAADGSLDFVDKGGNTDLHMPHGTMYDSNVDPHSNNPQSSNAVTYTLHKIAGKTILVVSVEESWLASSQRVYPVYIDPTTIKPEISDAYVSSAYPSMNYSGSNLWNGNLGHYDLHVGDYDSTTGDNRAFFKLPDSSQLPLLGLKVNSADFKAYCDWSYYSTTAEPIWLMPNTSTNWSPSTITWYTRPSHAASSIASASVHKGQWASFDITSLAESWFDLNNNPGNAPEQGFFLTESGNGQAYWHKVVAAEDANDAPYIEVNYDKPSAPWGAAYTHDDGTSGYVNLWWDAVPGATSYDVDIYNGHDYQSFNVGNTTHWTSKGKGIWPTQSEISSGVWQLHTDGKGTELATDPSAVYHNAYVANGGTDYTSAHHYYFRVQAVASDGSVSSTSDAFEPTMQPYIQDEGDAPTMVPLMDGEADGATGNFVLSDSDLSTTGYGPQVSISRTYNQNESGQSGPFGKGWTFNYQTHITVSNNIVHLISPDGSERLYWLNPDGTYTSPPGQSTWRLKKNNSGGFDLTLDDNTVEHFTQVGTTSNYHLSSVEDQNKNTLTFTYNSSNQLTSIKDASGRTTTLAYNTDGTIQSITDYNNEKWSYGYDSNGELTSVTDPAGMVEKYEYTSGVLTGITDAKGNTDTISYDSSGKVVGETNPAGKSESVSYGNGTVSYTDPSGVVTQWTYDDDHLTTQKVYDPTGLDRVWKYQYNEEGEATQVTDPLGNVTKNQYNSAWQLTSTTDPNGHTTTMTYGNSTYQNINQGAGCNE